MKIIWCMVPKMSSATDRLFVNFYHFLSFYPIKNPRNQNLEKMKKIHGDIIILHMSTKNHDYMLYCAWDMARKGCNYFSFWDIFCPFTPLTTRKMKISKKKEKNARRYHHFTQVYQKPSSYAIVFLRYGATDAIVIFHFGLFFCPFTPNRLTNKISKNWKKSLEISSYYTCVPKIMIRWCTVPEIWCATDRRTEGRMDGKSDIQRWVPHLNIWGVRL